MSILTIVQNAAVKIGVAQPSSVIGNVDKEVIELLAFAQEEAKELSRRHNWQLLRKEKTELTIAAEEQTALPSDFDRFVNETFWNRSRKHPLYGPLDAQEWQYCKNWVSSPVTDSFTVRGGKILINPVPAAGETIAYEYITKNVCVDTSGDQKPSFTLDSDTALLDERLIELGVIARFKLAKGLDAMSDVAKYDTQVMLAIGVESPKRRLNLGAGGYSFGPNVIVKEGDWVV